ncbi:dTMP kinase [Caldichromatium japonicum]|uniref:Thymidylate kinase n=1 Tax=Caldichromatium japonicum TaxID=2699430 RepID=A0A6G7VDE1_9GAMM|nr:dTMP kinase [Caldichromatium japonicum]QIK38069.1 dTMP kinase [Caldichromatium japonicum]
MTRHGRFITLEGIEGAGKSTQVGGMAEYLRLRGMDVITTREPGGTPLAERLRAILLDPANSEMSQTAELLLLFAARADHLERLIRPALAAGCWVICDRFTDATYAYQSGGRGIDQAQIAQLEALVHGDLRPDLTFILDIPPDLGLARARRRRQGETDRFEAETLEFFTTARQVYLQLAQAQPGRYRIIDATVSLEQVQAQIRQSLAELINELEGRA